MSRRSLVACVGLLFIVSCTGGNVSASQVTVDASPGPPTNLASATPTYAPKPNTCPKVLSTRVRSNEVQGQERTLVPGSPVTLVVCLGGHRRAITDEKTVVWFTNALNGLKVVPRGETFYLSTRPRANLRVVLRLREPRRTARHGGVIGLPLRFQRARDRASGRQSDPKAHARCSSVEYESSAFQTGDVAGSVTAALSRWGACRRLEVAAAVEVVGGVGAGQLVHGDAMSAGCTKRAARAVRDLEGRLARPAVLLESPTRGVEASTRYTWIGRSPSRWSVSSTSGRAWSELERRHARAHAVDREDDARAENVLRSTPCRRRRRGSACTGSRAARRCDQPTPRIGRAQPATRYRCQRSGTPFSSCSPASSNDEAGLRRPGPSRSARRGPRRAGEGADAGADVDRDPARPCRRSSSTSPVCRPARISSPSGRTASTIACAQRTARAGPSNVAKNPSPAVSISVPRYRPIIARTAAWCRSSSTFHAPSPSAASLLGRADDVGEEHRRRARDRTSPPRR